MASSPQANRRDFLRGKAALDALADAANSLVDAADPGRDPSTNNVAADASCYQLHYSRRAMACDFEVILPAGQHPAASEAALAALDLVDALESQMTVYRDSSEIMDINRNAAQAPMPVEPRLYAVLELAKCIHEQTAGAYDITSGPLSKVWGFYRRQGVIPAADELQRVLTSVGTRHLDLHRAGHTVHFLRHGVELNLGSIGKGYALDRCLELLAAEGIEHVLLHGGQSSVLARGSADGGAAAATGWTIGVRDPQRPGRRLAEIRLCDRALATSGSGVQSFRYQGRRYGHILDPRTGWPADKVLSATVVAPTAAEADALSTAFYVLGVEGTLDYCREHPSVGALLVSGSLDENQAKIDIAGLAAEDVRVVLGE